MSASPPDRPLDPVPSDRPIEPHDPDRPARPQAPDASASFDASASARDSNEATRGEPPVAPRALDRGDGALTVPVRPVVRERRRRQLPIYAAMFVVAVLAGSALFVSGFTLGRQESVTPGTSDTLQQRFEPFWDAYHKIQNDYIGTVDEKKLVEGAIDGMFKAIGDPYSSYMSSEQYRNSLSGISGQFEGIGAEMTSRDEKGESGCSPAGPNCRFIVVRALRDSPAQKAGLRSGDEVVAINGATVTGLTLDDAVNKVRGKKGTSVTLGLKRGTTDLNLTIVRDVIKVEDVLSEVLADGRVGYLRINGFSSAAAADFRDQLRQLVEEKKVRALILDLRDDPGGFVDSAKTIASQFISSGPIFWEEYRGGRKVPQEAETGGLATDPKLPLIALVNGGTASASEIVAAAIQETGRGRLLGEKTFGKGTIQQWQTLTNDTGGFRLSIAKWLTPKQNWIHGKGIQPDVAAKAPDETPAGKDPVRDRAVQLLLSQIAGLDELRPTG
jgi:carboxyl-terminal processing protease